MTWPHPGGAGRPQQYGAPAPGPWSEHPDRVCATVPTEVFFPPSGDPYGARDAANLCLPCPVIAECRAYALDNADQIHGVWGGTTRSERSTILRQRRTAETVERVKTEAVVPAACVQCDGDRQLYDSGLDLIVPCPGCCCLICGKPTATPPACAVCEVADVEAAEAWKAERP